jgi:hypothetical protein
MAYLRLRERIAEILIVVRHDNVLDISPNVTYTINCADFGAKHDLTIRSAGDPAKTVWFAPAGTTRFAEGAT